VAARAPKHPTLVGAFTARTHLGRLIRLASEEGQSFVLTKKGLPKVALVPLGEYEDLLEMRAEERDPALKKALRASASQIRRGEVSSLAALRAIYKDR
jgi:prevent-host-death family protein